MHLALLGVLPYSTNVSSFPLQLRQSTGSEGYERTTTALDAMTALLRGEHNTGNVKAQQARMHSAICPPTRYTWRHCLSLTNSQYAEQRLPIFE